MNFLVDAQLPTRLALLIESSGHDAIHTKSLTLANATPDAEINEISMREQRIVVTKDADFVESFLLQDKPYKLLLVATGNIRNAELEYLFSACLNELVIAFETHRYIELGRDEMIIHQ
ncbi:MAG: DUF5615 family PIN-like protein [Cyanobacteria bacterium J06560_2]